MLDVRNIHDLTVNKNIGLDTHRTNAITSCQELPHSGSGNSSSDRLYRMAQATTEDLQPHPNPVPNPHHRKIELQSHADLTFLQQNLARTAREKLDLHFPPQHSTRQTAPADVITLGGAPAQATQPDRLAQSNTNGEGHEHDEDPLRRHVRLLVDSFLQQTFQSASHSVTVNGIDASTIPVSQIPTCSNPDSSTISEPTQELEPSEEMEGIHFTYEPFDSRLRKRLGALYGELETLTAEVSKLRREAPRSSAKTYAQQLEATLAEDDQTWEAEQNRVAQEKHTGLELESLSDGWNEDVRDVYETGVKQLAVLSGVAQKRENEQDAVSLTETVGKVQRARGVAMEFE